MSSAHCLYETVDVGLWSYTFTWNVTDHGHSAQLDLRSGILNVTNAWQEQERLHHVAWIYRNNIRCRHMRVWNRIFDGSQTSIHEAFLVRGRKSKHIVPLAEAKYLRLSHVWPSLVRRQLIFSVVIQVFRKLCYTSGLPRLTANLIGHVCLIGFEKYWGLSGKVLGFWGLSSDTGLRGSDCSSEQYFILRTLQHKT